jgi:hypothetical protein
MNKKGVSPLVSTLILLVFATGLGAVVMSWGSSYERIEINEECKKTTLEIIEIQGLAHACLKEGNIYYTLQNTGENNINEYRITLLGSNQIQNIDVDQNFEVGEIITSNQPYNSNIFPKVDKILFMPSLGLGSQITCPKSTRSVDFIETCR